jgi:cell division septation protein DedD
MSNSSAPSGKPYVYAFSSGQLVLLVCTVLVLMALSLMLGIRIERHQQVAELEAFGTMPTVHTKAVSETVEILPEVEPAPVSPAPMAEEPVASAEASTPVPSVGKAAVPEPAPKPAPTAAKPEAPAPAPAPKPEPVKQVAAPKPPAPAVEKKEAVQGHYAVQITSSQDRAMATYHMQVLKEKNFPAFIQEVDLGSKGTFYRVLVGPYQSEDEARNVQKELQKDSRFAECYVRHLP